MEHPPCGATSGPLRCDFDNEHHAFIALSVCGLQNRSLRLISIFCCIEGFRTPVVKSIMSFSLVHKNVAKMKQKVGR